LGGNFPYNVKAFKIQKTVIRIITGCSNRNSCQDLFMTLKILPLQSQYISLLLFVAKNKKKKKNLLNSVVYNIHSRQKSNFHLPLSNSSQYQKGKNSSGKEVFNNQPPSTMSLTDNIKKIN
jgi:hypothetical protein